MKDRARHKLSFRGCTCCNETVTMSGAGLSRRTMLSGGAGLALSALAAPLVRAQTPAKVSIVDVHHHLAPPAYIADLIKRKTGLPPTLAVDAGKIACRYGCRRRLDGNAVDYHTGGLVR